MYSFAFHMWKKEHPHSNAHFLIQSTSPAQTVKPMTFSSLTRQLSLAHMQTCVVQCLGFGTKEWALKGIMVGNKVRWGPSPCRLLPGNRAGLFICYNSMDVSPCTWQEPRCDLLWTNDSAKYLVWRSQWIKLDNYCQIILLCVTLLQFIFLSLLFYNCVAVFLFFFLHFL